MVSIFCGKILSFNLGVEDINLLSGAEMTSAFVYIVFLNGEYQAFSIECVPKN